MHKRLQELRGMLTEVSDLRSAAAVLHWDQTTYMPAGGADSRARQISLLERLAHERFIQMVGQFARFDLGKSFFQNKAVSELILEKLPVSVSLGLWTFFISYLIAVPLGVAKAAKPAKAPKAAKPGKVEVKKPVTVGTIKDDAPKAAKPAKPAKAPKAAKPAPKAKK